MEENRTTPPADRETETLSQGDYEYDEARDASATSARPARTPRPASPPPKVDVGDSGDYGYDEAHDFGR